MPATDQEFLRAVDLLVTGVATGDMIDELRWEDGSKPTAGELRTMLNMYAYVIRSQQKPPGQRQAMKLLRSLLNPRQRQMLRSHRYFYVTSKSGATFRFYPRMGNSERVKRHGKNWFAVSSFCLHGMDNLEPMPPADLVVAHMLLIAADESAFMAMANENANNSRLWDGEYMRRMRQRRREAS